MSDKRIPFTAEDEDRIASASLWGHIVAIVGMLSAAGSLVLVLMAHASVPMMIARGLSLVVAIFLGIWLMQAGKAFRAVARTDVADKAFLLQGFDRLHKYFLTIGVLNILVIVAAVALVVLSVIFGTATIAARLH